MACMLRTLDRANTYKYYRDGRRVTREAYDAENAAAARRDTFVTVHKHDKWYFYSEARAT